VQRDAGRALGAEGETAADRREEEAAAVATTVAAVGRETTAVAADAASAVFRPHLDRLHEEGEDVVVLDAAAGTVTEVTHLEEEAAHLVTVPLGVEETVSTVTRPPSMRADTDPVVVAAVTDAVAVETAFSALETR